LPECAEGGGGGRWPALAIVGKLPPLVTWGYPGLRVQFNQLGKK